MALIVEHFDPRASAQELLALFERNGYSFLPEHFEWLFADNGYGKPMAWVLRTQEKRELLGFIRVRPRQLRWGATRLNVGLTSTIIVDKEERRSLAAISLLRAVQSLVSRKDLDILIGISKQPVRPLLLGTGFQVVGDWHTQNLVVRSARALRRRFGWWGGLLSPVIDVWAFSCRFLIWRSVPDFQLVEITGNTDLHVDSWTPSDSRFVEEPSPAFLRHFVNSPFAKYRILALVDPHSNRLCGYVVVSGDFRRISICACWVDAKVLREAEAILNVCRHWIREAETVTAETVRLSNLSKELRKLGFLSLPSGLSELRYELVGFWRADHPLAKEFSQPSPWNVLLESSYV